jgi:hypothetical protein
MTIGGLFLSWRMFCTLMLWKLDGLSEAGRFIDI